MRPISAVPLALTTLAKLTVWVGGNPAPTPTATIDHAFVIITPSAMRRSRPTPPLVGIRTSANEVDSRSSIATQFVFSGEALIQANGLDDPVNCRLDRCH